MHLTVAHIRSCFAYDQSGLTIVEHNQFDRNYFLYVIINPEVILPPPIKTPTKV